MKKLSTKNFRRIGYILIPIGILGYMLIVPPLFTPRDPSKYFWFWYSVRNIVALIFACFGIVGFLSLLFGILGGISWIKRLLHNTQIK
jgi:hypothetical protein